MNRDMWISWLEAAAEDLAKANETVREALKHWPAYGADIDATTTERLTRAFAPLADNIVVGLTTLATNERRRKGAAA